MFIRKYWLPLSVFIVAICAVGLYYLQTRPPKDPIVIIKPVEPLPKSEVKAPVGETSQGGHFHEDGTWHGEPHETPPRDTTAAVKEIEFHPKLTKAEYARLKALNKDIESNVAERQTLRAEMEKTGAETQEVYNQINALFDTPNRTAEEEAEIIALLNRAEELKAVVKRTFKKCEDLEATADTFVAEMHKIAKGGGKDE